MTYLEAKSIIEAFFNTILNELWLTNEQRKGLAEALEYKIPEPITLMEWHIIQMTLSKDSKLYIDDIEDVIQEIFQYRVDAATLMQPTNIENLDDKV